MAVVFWKINRYHFNSLVNKTSFDIAVEKYAQSGAANDLSEVRSMLQKRPAKAPMKMRPMDVVIERCAETGTEHDRRMLKALVTGRRAARP